MTVILRYSANSVDWGPITSKWLKIDLRCLRQKCCLMNLVLAIYHLWRYFRSHSSSSTTAALRLARFLQLFQAFVQSLQSLNFIRKLLNKFFCSETFKNVQNFCQNSTLVAETHAYMQKQHISATKQCAFGI